MMGDPPTKELTRNQALDILRSPKGDCSEAIYATLTRNVEMTEYDGNHKIKRFARAGTQVLVTMVSMFGYVGIRDSELIYKSYGYNIKVDPKFLDNWYMVKGRKEP